MHEYLIQILRAIPPDGAQAALNKFAAEGWQLHSVNVIPVQLSAISQEAIPGLYCVLVRKKIGLAEGSGG